MKTEGLFLINLGKTKTGQSLPRVIEAVNCPDTMPELLRNSKELVARLGDKVQQIYYTVGRVKNAGRSRPGIAQDTVLFDIDYVIQTRKQEYIDLFCRVLKLDPKKTAVIDSGYGLQFLVQLEREMKKEDWEKESGNLSKFARLFDLELNESGLVGFFNENGAEIKTHLDTSVFRLCSLARMPWTINHDPAKNRELRHTSLLQENLEPQAVTLGALIQNCVGGGYENSEAENSAQFRNLKIDGPFVKENCGLLRWALEKPEEVHENEFFLVIGLLKHCEESEEAGEQAALDYFNRLQKVTQSPTLGGYSEKRALEKIIRAMPASYASIDKHGDWCKADPGRPQNKHPFQMQSPTFVATEGTGFRWLDSKGKPGPVDYEGLTRFFVRESGHYIADQREPRKTLYRWMGRYYAPLYPAQVQKFALDYVNPPPGDTERQEFLGRMALASMVDISDVFHKNTEGKMNFMNGVLDVGTGELLQPDPSRGFTYVLPYEYDPKAQAPEFMKVIGEWMKDVEENIPLLQMWGGYVLAAGEPHAHKALILTGHGRNGKSAFADLLDGMLGSGASIAMDAESFRVSHHMAELQTRALAIIDEQKPNLPAGFWEQVKRLSAGGKVSAAKKFKDTVDFNNRAKIMIVVNELSSGTVHSEGFLSRLMIVNFPHFIPPERRDPMLVKRLLKDEGAGIAAWFVEGYRKLAQLGFQFPMTRSTIEALQTYQEETNMIYAFAKEIGLEVGDPCEQGFRLGDSGLHRIAQSGSGVWTDKLYETYCEFVAAQFPEDARSRRMESKIAFTKKLMQHFNKKLRVRVVKHSGKVARIYEGLRVNGQIGHEDGESGA